MAVVVAAAAEVGRLFFFTFPSFSAMVLESSWHCVFFFSFFFFGSFFFSSCPATEDFSLRFWGTCEAYAYCREFDIRARAVGQFRGGGLCPSDRLSLLREGPMKCV